MCVCANAVRTERKLLFCTINQLLYFANTLVCVHAYFCVVLYFCLCEDRVLDVKSEDIFGQDILSGPHFFRGLFEG